MALLPPSEKGDREKRFGLAKTVGESSRIAAVLTIQYWPEDLLFVAGEPDRAALPGLLAPADWLDRRKHAAPSVASLSRPILKV